MKKWIVFLLFLYSGYTYAQKINIGKWVKHNVDSLHQINIATIIYYNSFCGECFVKNAHYCEVNNSFSQIDNIIIYQQKGRFYTLTFDCNYPPIKKQLDSCRSIHYFISIVPTLNARDRYYKTMRKLHQFPPPTITDGEYENATIYCNKIKQGSGINVDMPPDLYKVWQNYFWFDKEIKLFKLIDMDLGIIENPIKH